ncbi:hypothetical protein RQP53_16900 [Paucibacter sp. APW11]|uniref:Uncharacterized protein n=1 Tax=Roseateles aquae TaxID=3077235 RepID=A0ABU3PFT2_9BURK|nr:hypothetical protein [Paucibacter sp. APW11]MDT9000958.1 hypothetical protein [Paucibacter sp. APW11]
MLKFLVRCLTLVLSAVLLLDALLSPRTELVQLDRHSSESSRISPAERSYTLHFAGGSVEHCSVGYLVYKQLADGDALTVRASRIIKMCTQIRRGDELIESHEHWRWMAVLAALLGFAVAFGWIRQEDAEIRW